MLQPIAAHYERTGVRRYFRVDAAFTKPEVYDYLGERGFLYAIRLPINDIMEKEIKHLLKRPEGELPEKPVIRYNRRGAAEQWIKKGK